MIAFCIETPNKRKKRGKRKEGKRRRPAGDTRDGREPRRGWLLLVGLKKGEGKKKGKKGRKREDPMATKIKSPRKRREKERGRKETRVDRGQGATFWGKKGGGEEKEKKKKVNDRGGSQVSFVICTLCMFFQYVPRKKEGGGGGEGE